MATENGNFVKEEEGDGAAVAVLETPEKQERKETAEKPGKEEPKVLEYPDDPDEFDEFFKNLPPDERRSLEQHLYGVKKVSDTDDDAEVADSEGDGDAGSGNAGPPKSSDTKGLPKEIAKELEDFREQAKLFEGKDPKKLMETIESLLDDPVIKRRAAELSGSVAEDTSLDSLLDIGTLREMDLDFNSDPRGSLKRLKNLVAQVVDRERESARKKVERDIDARSKATKAAEQVSDLISRTPELNHKSLAPMDPKHPVAPFLSWLKTNAGRVDVLVVGADLAYQAFLRASGKEPSVPANQKQTSESSVQQRRTAKTLPSGQVPGRASNLDSKFGIDPERYRNDDEYREKAYAKVRGNKEARTYLESLF